MGVHPACLLIDRAGKVATPERNLAENHSSYLVHSAYYRAPTGGRQEQFLGLEDPANRLPKAVARTAPMAFFIYTLVVVWFHKTGHQLLRFPFRPWYTKKEEPSFADMLTTLRRVSYEEKSPQPHPKQSGLISWIAQLTELLSRTG